MQRIITVAILFLAVFNVTAQNSLNMELLSNLTYNESLSDVWGYAAPNGDEYAIVGTRTTTSVVSLADPRNPVEVASFPGASSTWRDMKQFGEFVYATVDSGQDGLLVIDMSGAPNNITGEFWQPDITINGVTTRLETCHNIFIDEDGFGYLAGCNMNSGGVLIIDLFTTPGTPQFVGAGDARNSHDVMAQDDILYSSDIGSGFFSVVDVSDRSNPVTIATQTTSMFFTHNAWVSTDGNYLYTTDERANAYVDSYDISDLTDIKFLDSFQPVASLGTGTIPHNTHYFNGFLVTSWYTDGIRIIDGNKPDNLVEVGFFDTFLGNQAGFNGVWGATPYLPSGLVLASDIGTGLYVFEADYVRAAYLEGNVTDADTGLPLADVTVTIDSPQLNSKNSDALGDYRTGLAEPGEVMVTFSLLGYNSVTLPATIQSGEVTILDVALQPSARFSITGTVRSTVDNSPISNGRVLLQSDDFEVEVGTDENGVFDANALLEGEYRVFAGAWGYENIEFSSGLSLEQDETIEIFLGERLMDDFIVFLGWTIENFAETGRWVRDIPIGTNLQGGGFGNPNVDVEGDIGNKAYITGNQEGGAGAADIDDGTTRLISPMMDLTQFVSPRISYRLWFVNSGGNTTPNDDVRVRITNGVDTINVEILTSDDSEGIWRPTSSFLPGELMELTSTMQFIVESSDFDPGHLVEAGLDNFLVTESSTSTRDLVDTQIFTSSPNPFSQSTFLNFDKEITGNIVVTNILGQHIESIQLENTKSIELGQKYDAGVYLISLSTDDEQFEAVKIVKQ